MLQVSAVVFETDGGNGVPPSFFFFVFFFLNGGEIEMVIQKKKPDRSIVVRIVGKHAWSRSCITKESRKENFPPQVTVI